MDLAMGPVRLLAGPIARLLGVEGGTPEERRAEVIADASLPGEDLTDLGLRHLTRMSAWMLLFGLVFGGAALVLVPLRLFAAQEVTELAFDIGEGLVFFPFFVASVHLAKVMVAHYLPERRWNPRSRLGQVTMLAQTPEVLLAALLTVGSTLL